MASDQALFATAEPSAAAATTRSGIWTEDEHDRFLRAMAEFPIGPWSAIAEVVGTRSVRQVHSHAQKYAAKVERHQHGPGKRKQRRREISPSGHRVEPRIPGKFMNRATLTRKVPLGGVGRNKSASTSPSSGSSDEDDYSSAAASPLTSGHTVRSGHPISPSSVHGFQNLLLSELLVTSQDGPMDDEDDDGGFEPLPSLDESLDFFIAQLSGLELPANGHSAQEMGPHHASI